MIQGKLAEDKKIIEIIKELKVKYSIPGLAIGIQHEGKQMIYCEGITHINNPLQIDENTMFQIGSITKTITALAFMVMIENGLVDLDTPICNILTDFKMSDESVAKSATSRHLLTHTGGWEGDCFDCPDMGEASLKEFLMRIACLPQITPLGQIWAYNSMGFCIIGRIIEVLTGMKYEQAIEKLILKPLGMNNSTFSAGEAILKRVVVGHYYNKSGQNEVANPWELPHSLRPSGGLICSLRDMLQYASYLLHPEHFNGITSNPQTINSMFEYQCEASGNADAVGLSWMLKYSGDKKIIRHGGATFGQCSEIMLIPESNFALVILTNSGSGMSLIEEFSCLLLEQYFDITFKKPVPIAVDKNSLHIYEGCYVGLFNDIDVIVNDGELCIKYNYKPFREGQTTVPPSPPPMHAFFYARNRALIIENNIMCDFYADESENITFLRHGNKVHVKRK